MEEDMDILIQSHKSDNITICEMSDYCIVANIEVTYKKKNVSEIECIEVHLTNTCTNEQYFTQVQAKDIFKKTILMENYSLETIEGSEIVYYKRSIYFVFLLIKKSLELLSENSGNDSEYNRYYHINFEPLTQDNQLKLVSPVIGNITTESNMKIIKQLELVKQSSSRFTIEIILMKIVCNTPSYSHNFIFSLSKI